MKLRNKLKISFCVMVILPITLCILSVMLLFKWQAVNMNKIYGIENTESMLSYMFSPVGLMGSMTEGVYEEIKDISEIDPEVFNDTEFLKELDDRLSEKLSSLVVRKNGLYVYISADLDVRKLSSILPAHSMAQNNSDVGTYKGGDYQSLIKQVDFTDRDGDAYSVYIITSVHQIVPQIRGLVLNVIAIVIIILCVTSLGLNLWIYGSIIKPVDRLKLATDNIKKGNLDFTMPKPTKNEIGDVCRDFEEMRVILKQTMDDKLKSDQEEKELIRNISHDLKTPITAIKGYVEGILDGIADTPQKQERYLRTIANKVNDMDKLIDELTIYSKLDTNRVPYSFARINVKAYFDDCCEELAMDLESQNIELDYVYHPPEPVYVVADAEQLKRVVNNIISNSVKYMDEGRKGHIWVDIYDEGSGVRIVIKDNGKGISGADIPFIFERFYRTDSSRNSKKGGSGIGLAIVKKIIDDHKGKIWAESVEDEGTTMNIYLIKDVEKISMEENL